MCQIIVFFFFLLTALFPHTTEGATIEQVVVEFATPGNVPGNESLILQAMKSQEGTSFTHENFDDDLKALSKDYDRVKPVVEEINGKVFIRLTLSHFPLIRRIQWKGNQLMKTRKLAKELGIKKGDLYKPGEFNLQFNKVRALYVKEGYFQAQLSFTETLDPLSNEVDIAIFVEEGKSGKIRRIRFKNVSKADQNSLLNRIVTKTYSPFFSWITGQGVYNQDMVDYDQYQITQHFQNQGYADAQVTIWTEDTKQPNRLDLVICVDKGEPYQFGKVAFEGNTLFSDEDIKEALCFQANSTFSPALLQASIENINQMYGQCGYIDAYAYFIPSLREEQRVYDIHLEITEGKAYRVGLIRIKGNTHTEPSVILHECFLIPGEVFDLSKIRQTEASLLALGFFSEVNVYAVPPDENSPLPDSYRDIYIEVVEQNVGSAGIHGGMSTSSDAFIGLNVAERNFKISGLGSLFTKGYSALRGGGELAQINISAGSGSRTYALSWSKPHFLDTQWTAGFEVDSSLNRYISDNYRISSSGFKLFSRYEYTPHLGFGSYYRFRNSHVKVDWVTLRKDWDSQERHRKEENEEKKEEEGYKEYTIREFRRDEKIAQIEKSDGIVSAIGTSLHYDSTDRLFRPTCGFRSALDIEVAGVWGDHAFASFRFANTYYYPIGAWSTVKLRFDTNFIQPIQGKKFEEVPIDERLFLGGQNLIRGYRAYRLGPKFPSDKDEPQGGASLQLFSVEGSYLAGSLADLFVFYDAGAITKDTWSVGKVYQSAGLGARLYLMGPTAPISFGWGFPLTSADSNNRKRFFINMGTTF